MYLYIQHPNLHALCRTKRMGLKLHYTQLNVSCEARSSISSTHTNVYSCKLANNSWFIMFICPRHKIFHFTFSLQQNDGNDQICNVRPQDIVRSIELLAWLGIDDLDLNLKERRLRWYGHVECYNSAVKTAFHMVRESVDLGDPR